MIDNGGFSNGGYISSPGGQASDEIPAMLSSCYEPGTATDENRELILDRLRAEYLRAGNRLSDYVKYLCPGPHKPTQHRDARPPWCKACGRTATGGLVPSRHQARYS
ncbi:hypothetical protein GCM10010201_28180 [Pilimelia columellifera subsp. columellifera]|uniref:Uncharacterized protein n=1 Tax=Pilimelia columellifera subsp. columellifera TaxID=706583 RepID=A0ABP6AY06_9ACTN